MTSVLDSSLLSPVGGLIGLMLGTGLALAMWRMHALRPRLSHRVEPYLREPAGSPAQLTAHTPFPQVERMLSPIMTDIGRVLDRLGSKSHSVKQRLVRAGSLQSVEGFRTEQVIWATIGMGAGLFLSVVLATTRQSHPIILVFLVLVLTVSAALGRDYLLSRQVKQREEAMAAEFPTIAELLALAVSAGETPLAALERVSSVTSGVLSQELSTTLADIRSGIPLPRALANLSQRTEVAAISRFTDGVATAIERGTPLAAVLRSQAEDARNSGHHALMELGGKKEIAMMIPVVFLLLPITVLFALFPGLHMLSLS